MNKPRSLSRLLSNDNDGTLSHLVDRARFLEALNQALNRHLPTPLAGHCQVANLRDNTLILQAESTSWASRLRYQQPVLLKALRRIPGLQHLRDIHIRVAPRAAARQQAMARPRLSAQSARFLEQAAEASSDPALSGALRRIARHCNKAGPAEEPRRPPAGRRK